MARKEAVTENAVLEAIKAVIHPEINLSLLELGIVHLKAVSENHVHLELAIPFPQVPTMIIEFFKRDLSVALGKVYPEIKVNFTVRLMTDEERTLFLKLEHEHWKGLG